MGGQCVLETSILQTGYGSAPPNREVENDNTGERRRRHHVPSLGF